jgi:hypothetical protein
MTCFGRFLPVVHVAMCHFVGLANLLGALEEGYAQSIIGRILQKGEILLVWPFL